MPQRTINIDQSTRVLKFFWSTLHLEPAGVTTSYFAQTQESITNRAGALALHECLDWGAPYIRSVTKLKLLLKCIRSYLSRGNIETHLDQWIVAVEGNDAGNKEDLRDYLRGLTVLPDDSITISINLATYLLSGIEYLEAKADLAHSASEKYDSYNSH